jgi:hypothetical protein
MIRTGRDEAATFAGGGQDTGDEGMNSRQLHYGPIGELVSTVPWHGLHLSAGDAIRAHWYDKSVWPDAPTPLQRFALGPTTLLVAQSWAIPDTPYLPSARWWKHLRRVSDRALARVVSRVSGLVSGQPAVLDLAWRDAWRTFVIPGLQAEIKRRQRRRYSGQPERTPPIDVLEVMRRLTGEQGHERRGEVWFFCPFHRETVASLSVNPEKQVWYCLGCARGGGWKALQEIAA